MPRELEGVKIGDAVLCYRTDGSLVGIGTCVVVLATRLRIQCVRSPVPDLAGEYLISTGKAFGRNDLFARPATVEQIAAVDTELAAQKSEREQREKAKRQAAYDALPEAVQLARALRWLCDCESEKTLAEAPLEHLRGLVHWARKRGLTTQ